MVSAAQIPARHEPNGAGFGPLRPRSSRSHPAPSSDDALSHPIEEVLSQSSRLSQPCPARGYGDDFRRAVVTLCVIPISSRFAWRRGGVAIGKIRRVGTPGISGIVIRVPTGSRRVTPPPRKGCRLPPEPHFPRRTQPAPVVDRTASGKSPSRASPTTPTPQQSFSHFCVFCVSCAMVLLDNTLRHDAKKGPASCLRTGCAQAREPAGEVHPGRRISTP